MAVPTLCYFPAAITAGDTTRIQLSFGSYPATGWTAALILNKVGEASVIVTGTASADAFQFAITAAVSALLAIGQWTWAARVTDGTDTAVAQAGDFTVLANYASTIAKSATQVQLDTANTALTKLLASPRSSVSFNGQSFSKENQDILLDIIMKLEAKLAREKATEAGLRGDSPTRSIRPYFV